MPLVSAAQERAIVHVRGNTIQGHMVNQGPDYARSDELNLDIITPQQTHPYRITLQRYAKTKISVMYHNGDGCQFVFSEVLPNSESGVPNPGIAPNQGFVAFPGYAPYPGFVPYQGVSPGNYGHSTGTAVLTAMPITPGSVCHVDENASLMAAPR